MIAGLDVDTLVRLAAAAVATLLAITAMIVMAIRPRSLNNVVGVALAAAILVGYAVAAFGPSPVEHVLGWIAVAVFIAACAVIFG